MKCLCIYTLCVCVFFLFSLSKQVHYRVNLIDIFVSKEKLLFKQERTHPELNAHRIWFIATNIIYLSNGIKLQSVLKWKKQHQQMNIKEYFMIQWMFPWKFLSTEFSISNYVTGIVQQHYGKLKLWFFIRIF